MAAIFEKMPFKSKAQVTEKQPTSVKDCLPILDVKDGYLHRKDGAMVAYVTVFPFNFDLQSKTEKKNIISIIQEAVNGQQDHYQIHIMGKPTNIDEYLAYLNNLTHDTYDTNQAFILRQFIRWASDLTKVGTSQDPLYHIILPQGPGPNQRQQLYARAHEIAGKISDSGLVTAVIADQQIRELLFAYLHPTVSAFEKPPEPEQYKPMPMLKLDGWASKPITHVKSRNNPQSQLANILTPQMLDDTESSNYIRIGDKYARILLIPTDHYPHDVDPAWLAPIANIPGIVISVHIYPTQSEGILEDIGRSMDELEVKLNQPGKSANIKRTMTKYDHANILFDKIDKEKQNVFDVVTTFMVLADTPEDLKVATVELQRKLTGAHVRGRWFPYRQREGFIATGPWSVLPPEVIQFGRQNMPSETIAAMMPFTAAGLRDKTGTLYAKDERGSLIIIDRDVRENDRTNGNMMVFGKSGSGKSESLRIEALSRWSRGSTLHMLDPQGDFKDMCRNEYIKGNWIDGGGGNDRINPYQIRQTPTMEDDNTGQSQGLSPLAVHLQTLKTFWQLYIPELTSLQIVQLEQTAIEMYRSQKYPITWETDISKLDNEQFPDIRHHYKILKDAANSNSKFEDTAAYLSSAAEGAEKFLWAGPTTVTANSRFNVYDLRNLLDAQQRIMQAQYFNIFGFVWNQVVINRLLQQMMDIITDECHLLANNRIPQALISLANAFKLIRKYFANIIGATQNVKDLIDPEIARYTEAMLNNSTYLQFMRMGATDIPALCQLIDLSEKEQDILASAKRGEGIFIAGNQRLKIKVERPPFAPEIFGGAGGR